MAKFPTFDQITAMPLSKQALAAEERRHRARLQEIKNMSAALALLEAEHAAINAAGYTIYADSVGDAYKQRLTLRITGSPFDGDFRLAKALQLAGFAISDRGPSEHSYRSICFKKGRLTISVVMRVEDLERAESAAAAARAASPIVAPESTQ